MIDALRPAFRSPNAGAHQTLMRDSNSVAHDQEQRRVDQTEPDRADSFDPLPETEPVDEPTDNSRRPSNPA